MSTNTSSTGRILVVDDEESIRYTFRDFLEAEGHRVATAATYAEGAHHLREQAFDVVFVDIILDNRSGIELLDETREHPTAAATVFVVITGAPSVETAAEAVRLGALDYVVKPIRHRDLLEVTRRALGQRALRLAERSHRQNLEAIFRTIQDGIVTVDDEENLLEVNAAAKRICRHSKDVVAGRPLREFPTACSRACLEALRQSLAGHGTVDLPYVECDAVADAEQVVSVTATPLRLQDGERSGAMMVIRNQTPLVELERSLAESRRFGKIIGCSEGMRHVFAMIEALADVPTSVLVTGESGTGKELVADALHGQGRRRDKNLVKVNCAALSSGLLESELFGHVRGAFTGAVRNKIGRFQRADGGTLFLDEIGELSPAMQLRLLRVLETKEFERVGDSTTVKADVRVVAATNRDLQKQVEHGEIRQDFYFRLKVVEIVLPPLRERRADIPLLVDHFVEVFNQKLSKRITGVSDSVMELFMGYHWPGNIRQLENTLEHAFVMSGRNVITRAELPREFVRGGTAALRLARGEDVSGETELRVILEALAQARYNKSKAADLLGISRRTLYRKIDHHNIDA